MIHPTHRFVSAAILIALAGASTVAFAGLKDKPPAGVTLSGIEWQLDPYNSDDASAAVDRAGREARPTVSNRPVFGDDGPFGRSSPGNDPIGGSRGGNPIDRTGPNGGRGRDRDREASDNDPFGNQSINIQIGGGGRGSIFFESLRKNPARVSFHEGERSVTVVEDGLETECEAGKKEPFSDSFSDGERSCGWSGRAWVVETTRAKKFHRTDRYEISKDGKTLRYTTNANEDGVGRVTIERRYQIPPAK
jgi:hypothetical protein